RNWLQRNRMAETVVEEAARRDLFADGGEKNVSAEARGEFELERVLSCGRADLWGRTKLDFGSSEPFDHLHRSPTLGAAIKIRSVLGGGSVFFGKRFFSCAQQVKAQGQGCGTLAVGQEAEMADAHEALRK